MWAYMPRITMSKLHLQASTTYGTNHQYSTDGSPELGDVQIGGAWKTVLVAGLNGGGRGYYALDVTDPAKPKALWEICADATICSGTKHYPNLGLTFGNPQFGTWKDAAGTAHWVVFLTSGYNNAPGAVTAGSSPGEGILYVVDVANGQVLATVSTPLGRRHHPVRAGQDHRHQRQPEYRPAGDGRVRRRQPGPDVALLVRRAGPADGRQDGRCRRAAADHHASRK